MKHSKYLSTIFIIGLGGGLILKAVNGFVSSEKLATVANVLIVVPAILLVCMIPIAIAVNHCIDRKLFAKKKRRSQQSPPGDLLKAAPEE